MVALVITTLLCKRTRVTLPLTHHSAFLPALPCRPPARGRQRRGAHTAQGSSAKRCCRLRPAQPRPWEGCRGLRRGRVRSSAVLLCVRERRTRCSQQEKMLIWENEPKVIMRRKKVVMTDRTPSLYVSVGHAEHS